MKILVYKTEDMGMCLNKEKYFKVRGPIWKQKYVIIGVPEKCNIKY